MHADERADVPTDAAAYDGIVLLGGGMPPDDDDPGRGSPRGRAGPLGDLPQDVVGCFAENHPIPTLLSRKGDIGIGGCYQIGTSPGRAAFPAATFRSPFTQSLEDIVATIRTTARRVATLAAATGGAIALASPAIASSQTTTHDSFDPSGAVFSCTGGDLTVQSGGTVDQVMHFGQDKTGVFHYTGTITVHNITATDAAGNLYRIVGATWFGGKATSDGQNLIATDTDHFVIHNASGGVYAKVQVVDHFNANGNSFTFNFGACAAPQG
ncbi:MAG: hypothetical protein ACR2F6_05585 [Mycobacteriales bacterium]